MVGSFVGVPPLPVHWRCRSLLVPAPDGPALPVRAGVQWSPLLAVLLHDRPPRWLRGFLPLIPRRHSCGKDAPDGTRRQDPAQGWWAPCLASRAAARMWSLAPWWGPVLAGRHEGGEGLIVWRYSSVCSPWSAVSVTALKTAARMSSVSGALGGVLGSWPHRAVHVLAQPRMVAVGRRQRLPRLVPRAVRPGNRWLSTWSPVPLHACVRCPHVPRRRMSPRQDGGWPGGQVLPLLCQPFMGRPPGGAWVLWPGSATALWSGSVSMVAGGGGWAVPLDSPACAPEVGC